MTVALEDHAGEQTFSHDKLDRIYGLIVLLLNPRTQASRLTFQQLHKKLHVLLPAGIEVGEDALWSILGDMAQKNLIECVSAGFQLTKHCLRSTRPEGDVLTGELVRIKPSSTRTLAAKYAGRVGVVLWQNKSPQGDLGVWYVRLAPSERENCRVEVFSEVDFQVIDQADYAQ